MGINDHLRGWTFVVKAKPSDCEAAFSRAMTGSSTWNPMGSKWKVSKGGGEMVAVYGGRSELARIITSSNRISAGEAQSALGSEVRFVAKATGSATECRMWLASKASIAIVGTADARFIRPAMQRVEKLLRELDPQLSVVKQ